MPGLVCSPMRHPPSSFSAFTIVELLVVITIITVLISLLQPALGKSRRKAQAVQCSAQIRQVGNSLPMFAQDNKGKLFGMVHLPNQYWFGKLRKYWNNDDRVLVCPNTVEYSYGLGSATRTWGPMGGWGDNIPGSYGMNLWLLPYADFAFDTNLDPTGKFQGFYRNIDRTGDSNIPTFGDSQWVGSWPDHVDFFPTNLINPPNNHTHTYFMSRFCVDRHDYAINVSFLDGSARLVQIPDLWKLKWHANFVPTTPVIP